MYLERRGSARSECLEYGRRGQRRAHLKEQMAEEVKSLINRHKIAKKERKKANLTQKSIRMRHSK